MEHSAWVEAYAIVVLGVTVGKGTVLSIDNVVSHSLAAWMIYMGIQRSLLGARVLNPAAS